MNKMFLQALLLAGLSAQPLLAQAQGSGLEWRLSGYDVYFREPGQRQWQRAPGTAIDVSDGWVIGTDPAYGGYSIYRWNGLDWDRAPGGAVKIGGSYSNPWVVNDRGESFSWDGYDWRLETDDNFAQARVYVDRSAPTQLYQQRFRAERSPPVRIYEERIHVDRGPPARIHESREHLDRPWQEQRHDDRHDEHRDHDHDADQRTGGGVNFNSNQLRTEVRNQSRDERLPANAPAPASASAPARPAVPAPAPDPVAPVSRHEGATDDHHAHVHDRAEK